MPTLKEAAEKFLKLKRIAVAGVSSTKKEAANYIFEKLKTSGYEVFAVNPKTTEIDGNPCYHNLSEIPAKLEGVVVCTHPKVTLSIVKQCAELKVKHVWIHRAMDQGSYSPDVEEYCIEHRINLIPAGCPMMFCRPVDFPHKCIKWVLQFTGKLPKSLNT